jgi:hypothetical protein
MSRDYALASVDVHAEELLHLTAALKTQTLLSSWYANEQLSKLAF